MSTQTARMDGFIQPDSAIAISLSFAVLYILYQVAKTVYVGFFGPLSKFPGPNIRALSAIPKIRTVINGNDNRELPELHKKFGPVVRISPRELSFASGQAWKDIYGFKKHGQVEFPKDRRFYSKPINGVDGLITANNADHARQRKIVSHAFSDKALKEQEPMLKHWADKMKEKLMERAESGQKTDMLSYYNFTTFDVMGDLTFAEPLHMLEGSEYSPWVKTIYQNLKAATMIRTLRHYDFTNRMFALYTPASMLEKQKEHFKYSTDRVDKRLATTPDRPDLWTRIMEKPESEGGLSLGEHHSNASLFMVAGTETTATLLSGVTFHLLKNPETLKQLVDEVRSTFISADDMGLENLTRMTYLNAVLQEGLRSYPPVPSGLPRKVPAGGAAICGEWVPEGTVVSVHQLSTYKLEQNFKDPEKFAPERWLGDPRYADDDQSALEPFSIGPRNCLGKNLAWHEMRLLLATVVWNFDLSLCEESQDWTDQSVFTLWEKKPLMCKLTPVKS